MANKHDLIFYSARSTPQVVLRDAAAKPKKGYGEITKRRRASEEEEAKIEKGIWVRVDEDGNTPGDENYKKTQYRPNLIKAAILGFGLSR